MSTRANIIIKDDYRKLYFYRHSDGYPEGVMPTLKKFLEWVKENKIRASVSQSAGWLIIFGAIEYLTIPEFKLDDDKYFPHGDIDTISNPKDWKVGAFEPTTGIHGDIEHLYVVDLNKKTIEEIPPENWKDWE
jgi:hypothetical protein